MRVVIADDHRLFLEALTGALVHRGYDVVGSSDHLEGLVDLVVSRQPELCLLDVDFGGRTVFATAEAIRRLQPGISLVLLTGAATPALWSAFEDRTVDGVVSKLCDVSVVIRTIERVRAGERVVEQFARPALRRAPEPMGTKLSGRERAVVEMLMRGATTAEMAAELGITTHTVRTHVQSVLRKLGVSSRVKAARWGVDMEDAGAGSRR